MPAQPASGLRAGTGTPSLVHERQLTACLSLIRSPQIFTGGEESPRSSPQTPVNICAARKICGEVNWPDRIVPRRNTVAVGIGGEGRTFRVLLLNDAVAVLKG